MEWFFWRDFSDLWRRLLPLEGKLIIVCTIRRSFIGGWSMRTFSRTERMFFRRSRCVVTGQQIDFPCAYRGEEFSYARMVDHVVTYGADDLH